jgi:hypothetical protein
VPYALVAEQAHQADVSSTAITSTYATTSTYAATASYATTATYALNGQEGVDWSHVVVVAKSGGDYTTVSDAMNAISPSITERYLVLVMPGVYEEQVTLKSFVHLKGAGVDSTLITSAANTTNFNDDAAATLRMPADSQISDLGVQNSATSNDAVALKILSGNVDTILDNVAIQTIALGGVRHIGLYINTGSPRLNNVDVQAKGGTTFNRGINSVAATPVIRNTAVIANGTQPSGLHISGGAPAVLESVINATNGTNGNGITTNGAGNDVHIDRSSIGGDTGASGHSIFSTDNVNFFVGASLMKGSVLAFDFNHITCSQAYDENYLDLNADCN